MYISFKGHNDYIFKNEIVDVKIVHNEYSNVVVEAMYKLLVS